MAIDSPATPERLACLECARGGAAYIRAARMAIGVVVRGALRAVPGPNSDVALGTRSRRTGCLQPGTRVLDVACGTGVVARLAASYVGERGRVTALDLNGGMLAVGRSLPLPKGAPVAWCEGSANALPFDEGEFDVVLCQLGLQFFPDRRAALREMRRVLAAAGRIGASVYTSIDRNPAANALADAVDKYLGARASVAKRSEHSLADPDELCGLFNAAGFAEVQLQTVTQTMRFPSVENWVEIQFAAAPLAALVADRDPTSATESSTS
jgi:ubiquinone/menaquinone biosynthesis C-methylase UbiE